MDNQFEVKQEGAILTIVLGNELATANAPALMDELNNYRDKGIEKVVFDATNLTYIASSGIRTIIFAKQKLGADTQIFMKDVNDDVMQVLEMTGSSNFITII